MTRCFPNPPPGWLRLPNSVRLAAWLALPWCAGCDGAGPVRAAGDRVAPISVTSTAPSASPVPLATNRPPIDQAAATELELAWAVALERADADALEELLDDAFSITGVGSTAADPVGDKREWLMNAQRYPWPFHEVLDVRVTEIGGDAILVKCLWRGVYPPESLTVAGGLTTLLVSDVWVRRGERWTVVSRHTSLPASD